MKFAFAGVALVFLFAAWTVRTTDPKYAAGMVVAALLYLGLALGIERWPKRTRKD